MACLLVLTKSVVDRFVANVETDPPKLKNTIPAAITVFKLLLIILSLLTLYFYFFDFVCKMQPCSLSVSHKLIITEKIAVV